MKLKEKDEILSKVDGSIEKIRFFFYDKFSSSFFFNHFSWISCKILSLSSSLALLIRFAEFNKKVLVTTQI